MEALQINRGGGQRNQPGSSFLVFMVKKKFPSVSGAKCAPMQWKKELCMNGKKKSLTDQHRDDKDNRGISQPAPFDQLTSPGTAMEVNKHDRILTHISRAWLWIDPFGGTLSQSRRN